MERRALGSRALMFLGAASVMSGLVACENDVLTDAPAPESIRPSALANYVQPAGLRPVAVPGSQMAPAAPPPSVMTPPRFPGARMPAAPEVPASPPSVVMPMQSPGMQMPAAPAASVVMMPAPVESSGAQTGSQMFAGFFAGLASSFAIGFTITAKRIYDGMKSEGSLRGSARDLELGNTMMMKHLNEAQDTLEFGMLRKRAGVPTMMAADGVDGDEGIMEEAGKKIETQAPPVPVFTVKELPGITDPLGFFDPLGFCEDASEGKIKFYREVELKHGRVAMLAALGFLVGEQFHPLWGGKIDVPSYIAFQQTPLQTFWPAVVLAISIAEVFSVFSFNTPFGGEPWSIRSNYTNGDLGFDPLGLKPTNPAELKEIQNKELNNGRLAMIAVAGMVGQELTTGSKLF